MLKKIIKQIAENSFSLFEGAQFWQNNLLFFFKLPPKVCFVSIQ